MPKVLAVDDYEINLKLIETTLSLAGFSVTTADSGASALQKAEEVQPDVIVLDLTMPDMDGFEVCRRLRQNPRTRPIPVIFLTAVASIEEKLKAFELGADDYLTKPFQPAELSARVKSLVRRGTAPAEPGGTHPAAPMIAAFSLRGGVGVSTLACNLAAGMAALWKKPVALVDLALRMGQCAMMLNLPLRSTWSDLGGRELENLDAEVVGQMLLEHPGGVRLLAAPRSPVDAELVPEALVAHVLGVLRGSFDCVVVDLPHDFSETTLACLDSATQVLLMMAPELASVRAAVGALEVFERLSYPKEKVKILINSTFEQRALGRKEIEGALKRPVDLVIPFAPLPVISGINLGVPPVIQDPRGSPGALFEDLAFFLSREEQRNKKPETPSEAWQRVAARLKKRS